MPQSSKVRKLINSLQTGKFKSRNLQCVLQVSSNVRTRKPSLITFYGSRVWRGTWSPCFYKGWYDSFKYPQFGFKIEAGKLHLSKIGDIKIKLHRQKISQN